MLALHSKHGLLNKGWAAWGAIPIVASTEYTEDDFGPLTDAERELGLLSAEVADQALRHPGKQIFCEPEHGITVWAGRDMYSVTIDERLHAEIPVPENRVRFFTIDGKPFYFERSLKGARFFSLDQKESRYIATVERCKSLPFFSEKAMTVVWSDKTGTWATPLSNTSARPKLIFPWKMSISLAEKGLLGFEPKTRCVYALPQGMQLAQAPSCAVRIVSAVPSRAIYAYYTTRNRCDDIKIYVCGQLVLSVKDKMRMFDNKTRVSFVQCDSCYAASLTFFDGVGQRTTYYDLNKRVFIQGLNAISPPTV